jgi:hypothetical protein
MEELMPILYVHGVNVRSRQGFLGVDTLLRRYIAPQISDKPDTVLIDDVFWGDAGVEFAWDGASRPRTRLIGMGSQIGPSLAERTLTASEFAQALKKVPDEKMAGSASTGGLAASGAPVGGGTAPSGRMHDLQPDELRDGISVRAAANGGIVERDNRVDIGGVFLRRRKH